MSAFFQTTTTIISIPSVILSALFCRDGDRFASTR